MTPQELEQRLREKVPPTHPGPGFESRLQALTHQPEKTAPRSRLPLFALPVVPLVALALLLLPKNPPAPAPVVNDAPPAPPPSPIAVLREPVAREVAGLKKDAERALSHFQSALPSVASLRQSRSPQ